MNFLKKVFILNFIIIALSLCFLVFNANAEEVKIFTVDSEKIAESSVAFKEARKKIDEKREQYEAKSAKMQETLTKKFQDLEKRKNVISTEAYNKEREQNIVEAEKYQRTAYMERANLEQAYQALVNDFYEKLTEVITKKAKDKNASLVLNKMHVLYSEDKLDITDLIIEQLNKDLKIIKVKFNNNVQ